MARRSALRRQEFSFPPGSPARGEEGDQGERRTALPPRPRPAAANSMAPRAGEEDFRWLQASRLGSPESAGSGTPSPQLWVHGHGHHHRLYPASAGSSPSRAQAIAGYRREMLDLVSGLPEAAYELSLRDIVESRPSPSPSPSPLPLPPPPPPLQPPHSATVQEQGQDVPKKDVAAATAVGEEAKESSGGAKKQVKAGKARKQRTMGRTRSRNMERSVSLDTGLFIKLFLPLSVGRKKVSPKPAGSAAAKNGEKKKKKHGKEEEEDEWWKKSESSEAGSSSRTSSTSSTNSTASRNGNGGSNPKPPARSRSRKRIGCYAFFRADKSKNGVIQE